MLDVVGQRKTKTKSKKFASYRRTIKNDLFFQLFTFAAVRCDVARQPILMIWFFFRTVTNKKLKLLDAAAAASYISVHAEVD